MRKTRVIGLNPKVVRYIIIFDLFLFLLLFSIFSILLKNGSTTDQSLVKLINRNLNEKINIIESQKKIIKEDEKLFYYNKDKKILSNEIIIVNGKKYKNSKNGILTKINNCDKTKCININAEGIYNEVSKYLQLINKKNMVDEKMKPSNLVNMGEEESLEKEAYSHFIKMQSDFTKQTKLPGFELISSFRSYEAQVETKHHWIDVYGKDSANKVSADPGSSEHQTGLAIDIQNKNNENLNTMFENTKEFEWLKNNSFKYGYILRYIKGKTNVTQYNFEPWHYRYVGVENANDIMKVGKNATLEEYYDSKKYYYKK